MIINSTNQFKNIKIREDKCSSKIIYFVKIIIKNINLTMIQKCYEK